MIWIKRIAAAALVISVATALWLWLTMLSPWFYERPAHLGSIEQRSHQVFVYGTLRFAPIRWVVMHAGGDPEPDALEGFNREGLDIAPSPQSEVPGLMLTVTPEQFARLDRYERLGIRYRREEITLESGELAWVYRRLPEGNDQSATAPKDAALLGYNPLATATTDGATPPAYSQPAANDARYFSTATRTFKETL